MRRDIIGCWDTHTRQTARSSLLEFAGKHVGQLVHSRLGHRLVDLLTHVWRQLRVCLLQLLDADAAAHSRNATDAVNELATMW